MLELFTSQASTGYMVPWSFLFATALIASALDAFSKRPFNPVVMTAWFFGLTVAGSIGAWSIPELAAGAICLVTPHLLICSIAGRSRQGRASEAVGLVGAGVLDGAEHPAPLSFDADDAELQPERERRAA